MLKEFRELVLRGNVVDLAIAVVLGVAFTAVVLEPVNALMALRRMEPAVDAAVRACPECLSDIPAAARRCAFCTATVEPTAAS